MNCSLSLSNPAPGIHPALPDPWEAAPVIALLIAIHGPAYRGIGAAVAIRPDGLYAGAITSGCVEAELILRAGQVRRSGQPQRLRYSEGTAFFDLRQPAAARSRCCRSR